MPLSIFLLKAHHSFEVDNFLFSTHLKLIAACSAPVDQFVSLLASSHFTSFLCQWNSNGWCEESTESPITSVCLFAKWLNRPNTLWFEILAFKHERVENIKSFAAQHCSKGLQFETYVDLFVSLSVMQSRLCSSAFSRITVCNTVMLHLAETSELLLFAKDLQYFSL